MQKPDGTPLFENRQEVERHITGAYTQAHEHGKRPLSKLITDIATELGLLP